jgi:hypothetical protein
MRIVAALVLAGLLALAAPLPSMAQDQATTCRSLALRGLLWADCCARSFARRGPGTMLRRARMEQIERCARNGGRLPP